jgi:hypothetical protein
MIVAQPSESCATMKKYANKQIIDFPQEFGEFGDWKKYLK